MLELFKGPGCWSGSSQGDDFEGKTVEITPKCSCRMCFSLLNIQVSRYHNDEYLEGWGKWDCEIN